MNCFCQEGSSLIILRLNPQQLTGMAVALYVNVEPEKVLGSIFQQRAATLRSDFNPSLFSQNALHRFNRTNCFFQETA